MNHVALRQFFDRQAPRPQRLGTNDCVTFVMGALLCGWGRDFTADMRYNSRRTAVERLREAGGLEAAFTERFGEPINAMQLPAGSIALLAPQQVVGLVMPSYIAVRRHMHIDRVRVLATYRGWRTDGC